MDMGWNCLIQYLATDDDVPTSTNTRLSRHRDPVLPHFYPQNQTLACVSAKGGGGSRYHVPLSKIRTCHSQSSVGSSCIPGPTQ